MIEEHRDLVVEEYSWFRIFLLIFAITSVIGFFGFDYFSARPLILNLNPKNKNNSQSVIKKAKPSVVVKKITPTPTVIEVKLERKDLKIQVLNGSQKTGLAKKTKDILEKIGYEKVAIGNAAKSDYENSEISIKSSKKDYANLLINDLKTSHKISSSIKDLSKESNYDVVIILGNLGS